MPFGWFKKSTPDTSDTKEPDSANEEIEKRMAQERKATKQSVSLLLLGAGGCGKSTLFKQMQNIYGGKTPEKEMELTTVAVRRQIMEDIVDLCRANIELAAIDKECIIDDEKARDLRDKFATSYDRIDADIELTPELAESIQHIWKQSAIKKTFTVRSKSHVMESTPYFMNKVIEIGSSKYNADYEDHVRVRYRTVGVLHATFHTTFQTQNWTINVTDVGGQRNERKKWIHLFAEVDAVLYVMSLNGYDKVLYEDNSRNCWDESFQIFSDITGLKVFSRTSFIVFLNKHDLLEELIKEVPFTVYSKKCPSEHAKDPDYIIAYAKEEITERFNAASKKLQIASSPSSSSSPSSPRKTAPPPESRALHFHVTCATDRNQIEKVLRVLQFEATKSQLQNAGLI